MGSKAVVLVDINILMDILQHREPFYESSAHLLDLIVNGSLTGWIAAHSLTTLHYLIAKNHSISESRKILSNLLNHFSVAQVDQIVIKRALELEYKDFEGSVQMICAVQCKADYLITRNVKDYQPALLSVLQPVDFLAIFSQNNT